MNWIAPGQTFLIFNFFNQTPFSIKKVVVLYFKGKKKVLSWCCAHFQAGVVYCLLYVLSVHLICRWAKIYFVAWWLISSVIWVNLFVALLLEVRKGVCLGWDLKMGSDLCRKWEEPRQLCWVYVYGHFTFLLAPLCLRSWGIVLFFLENYMFYLQFCHKTGYVSMGTYNFIVSLSL